MKTSLAVCAMLAFIAADARAQDWAKTRLDQSPRHQEWVRLTNGTRTVQCFVVYPEVNNKTTAIVMVHEIFGLTDWAREMADELAARGYIVVEPDLLSGMGPDGGGTDAFADQSARVKAVSSLPPKQVAGDLTAAADYAASIPAANGKVVTAGFCWGGGQAFRFAADDPHLKAAFVFYGTPPPAPEMAKILCPVYGFYGGNDARVTATVPQTIDQMKAAGKPYEPVTYPGAGHGFMRAGEAPDAGAANKRARIDAFQRLVELLNKI